MIDLLVIVPHEDDELAIAGPMIYAAAKKNQKVKIVFSTNGDYFPHEASIRMREALAVAGLLGVKKEDVIFLGYGDQVLENGKYKHLYNSKADDIVPSFNGRTKTYGSVEKQEWAMEKYGVHHSYTRNHLKGDIRSVIEEFLPRIIITTGWDNHMDHLALCLLVDEVIGELLKEKDYHPLILKGLAYNGKWEGPRDYHKGADWTENENLAIGTEKQYPLHKWEDRIRFFVPEECHTSLLKHNVLYKAAGIYKSQSVDFKAIQFLNRDLVYWRRETESRTYQAKIEVSSGNGYYLNDFKCGDSSDITGDPFIWDQGIWIPDETDACPTIRIVFDEPKQINEICLYENPDFENNIMDMQVRMYHAGTCAVDVHTGELEHDGAKTIIDLQKTVCIDSVELVLVDRRGIRAGLTEVELYGGHTDIASYDVPLELLDEENENSVEVQALGIRGKSEDYVLKFKEFGRNRLWPYKYFLMKKNANLKETDSMWKFWKAHIKFFFEKVKEKVRR